MKDKLKELAKLLGYANMDDFYFYFVFCGIIPLAALIYLLIKTFVL